MNLKRITTSVYLLAFISIHNVLIAQSEEEQVRSTINTYIEGTSYNKPEVILEAFYEEALLFLSHKEQPLYIKTINEYASFFEKREKGKFNGRTGKILSVDVVNDIAQAKAAIFIEGKDVSYIDIFLLKKLKGQWKIISKAATIKKSK